MTPISEESARNYIEPHIPKIRKAIQEAMATFYEDYKSLRHRHTARTDANICRDLIVSNMREAFDGVSGVRFKDEGQLFLVIINDMVVLKFKKFNRKLLSSNIATRQSQLLLRQELPGMPPNGLLHVGYLVNALNTDLEGIYITCRLRSENIWEWNISDIDVSSTSIHEFPTQPQRKRKFSAKKKKEQEKGKGDSGTQ